MPGLVAAWVAAGTVAQAGPVSLSELPPPVAPAAPRADAAFQDRLGTATEAGDAAAGAARRFFDGDSPARGAAARPLAQAPVQRADPAEPAPRPAGMVGTPRPLPDPGSPVPGQPSAPQTAGPLPAKEFARGALDWLQDLVPWARKSDGAANAAAVDVPIQLDASGSDADFGTAAGRGGDGFRPALDPRAAVLAPPGADPAERRHAAGSSFDEGLRSAVAVVRLMLAHPLTWLVLAILGIAQFVVSRDRRDRP